MKATYRDHGGTDLSVVNAARVSFSNSSDWDYVPTGQYKIFEGNHLDEIHEKVLKAKDVNLIQYLARGLRKSEWEAKIHELALIGSKHQMAWPKEKDMNDYAGQLEYEIISLMNMAQHWAPFGHTMISLHMQAPIPIARQAFKHKVGFVESEESRRYISHNPELFVPTEFRSKAEDVKQGSGGVHPENAMWLEAYQQEATRAIHTYEDMIEAGIAPEQARFILPQGAEVQWVWTGSLVGFARFVLQRRDPHAQLEIQQLSKQVSDIIAPLFPVSWDALMNSGRIFNVDVE